jgi:hypothetical protein
LASVNFKHTTPQNTKTQHFRKRKRGKEKQNTPKLSTIDTAISHFGDFFGGIFDVVD